MDQATNPKRVDRNMPGCTVTKVVSAGISPDQSEGVLICETKEQGEVAIKIPLSFIHGFGFAAEALRQSANKVLPPDEQQVPATVVKRFEVGRTNDVDGVLLMVHPREPDEQFFVFNDQGARACGNALMGAAFKAVGKPTILHNKLRGRLLDALGRPIDFTKKH